MKSRETQAVVIDGRNVNLSNASKVLFPHDGITKGEVLAYYAAVARWILPHLKDRPLTLERYPDGIEGSSFFEKNIPRGAPDWVQTVRVESSGSRKPDPKPGTIDFIVCNDASTLLWLVNLGAFVMHIWTSRVGSLDVPDFVLFDLDPFEGCTVTTLATVALELKETLAAIGLTPLVKTTGGSGLHVVVPLAPTYTYDDAKAFAELVARQVAKRAPKLTTLERTVAARPKATVYLDYVQVGKGKTIAPPYGLRAREGAPVSMPISWEEVEAMKPRRSKDTTTEMRRFTLKNALARLQKDGDLWGNMGSKRAGAKLEPALAKAKRAWQMEK